VPQCPIAGDANADTGRPILLNFVTNCDFYSHIACGVVVMIGKQLRNVLMQCCRVEKVERRRQETKVGTESASSVHPAPGVAARAEVPPYALPQQC